MTTSETATDTEVADDPAEPGPPRRWFGIDLNHLRWAAVLAWAVALGAYIAVNGIPIDRLGLIFWLLTGLIAVSIGWRPITTVFIDWLPFAAILIAYDRTRGLADALGRPTLWTPQLQWEKDLFGGIEPTVWLQSHLKDPQAAPWEVIVSCTYVSYFLAPYVVSGILWIRDRGLYRRFAVRFVLVNLIGLSIFIVFPAAPPWAAAQCTAAEVARHPSNPPCLDQPNRLSDNGLLGPLDIQNHGASKYIERIGTRGFERYGLRIAANIVDEGQADVNPVAAIPSLHAGLSMLIAVFLWPLVRRRWWPLLALYPLVMAFSLVYSAEHYVVDILAGWLVTAVVCVGTSAVERAIRAKRRDDADRVKEPTPA